MTRISMAYQDLKSIDAAVILRQYPRVTEIDLSNNLLESVEGLDEFRDLAVLVLDQNLLGSHTRFPLLPKVHTLSINSNKIKNLASFIAKLAPMLPALHHLSMLNNEACPNYLNGGTPSQYDDYRLFVISKVPQLKFLDSQKITPEERVKATRLYANDRAAALSKRVKADASDGTSSGAASTAGSKRSHRSSHSRHSRRSERDKDDKDKDKDGSGKRRRRKTRTGGSRLKEGTGADDDNDHDHHNSNDTAAAAPAAPAPAKEDEEDGVATQAADDEAAAEAVPRAGTSNTGSNVSRGPDPMDALRNAIAKRRATVDEAAGDKPAADEASSSGDNANAARDAAARAAEAARVKARDNDAAKSAAIKAAEAARASAAAPLAEEPALPRLSALDEEDAAHMQMHAGATGGNGGSGGGDAESWSSEEHEGKHGGGDAGGESSWSDEHETPHHDAGAGGHAADAGAAPTEDDWSEEEKEEEDGGKQAAAPGDHGQGDESDWSDAA